MSPSYSKAQKQEIKLPEPHEQVMLIMHWGGKLSHCPLALHQAFLVGSRGALEVSIKITAEWRGNRELRRGGPTGGNVAALETVGMKSWNSLLLATWLFLCLERRQHPQLAYS